MRKMQSRVPFLSEPERNMKRELESMDEKLETYQRNLEQVRAFVNFPGMRILLPGHSFEITQIAY